nr:DUF4145 domain-containing protein [Rhodothermus marinus]
MGFRANETGKCPHCGVTVRFERVQVNTFSAEVYMIQTPSQFRAILHIAGCPHCGKPVLSISKLVTPQGTEEVLDSLVWPDIVVRPVPPEVEAEDPVVAADFREAVAVLPKSKKAAAALARRCLQHILREKAGTKAKDLSKQIEEVLGQLHRNLLPTWMQFARLAILQHIRPNQPVPEKLSRWKQRKPNGCLMYWKNFFNITMCSLHVLKPDEKH